MKRVSKMSRPVLWLVGAMISVPAWATWDGKVVVAETPPTALQGSTLTFQPNGQTLPVTVQGEDEDGNAILIIPFTGDAATPGTLTISRPGQSPVAISTPAAGPGQEILVDTRGPGTARTRTAMPPSARPLSYDWPKFGLTAGYGFQEVKGVDSATAAVIIPSVGAEYPNLRLPKLQMDGGSIGFSYNAGRGLPEWIDPKRHSRNLTFTLNYETYSGSDSGSADFPSGSDTTGFLYTRDLGSSTGTAAGPAGAVSTATIKGSYDRFEIGMGWPCIRDWGDNIRVSPLLRLSYTDFGYRINSRDTFDPGVFPDTATFVTRNQRVQQDILELGLGGRVQKIFGANGGLDVFSDFSVNLYNNKTKLRSLEDISILGSADQIQFDDKDSKTSVGFNLGLGLGVAFSDRMRLEAAVGYTFNEPVGYAANPVEGAVDRTPLQAQVLGEDRMRARFGFRFAF